MNTYYVERMRSRLRNMRKVAAMSHDPRIVEIVTETADQLEQDIRELEAEASAQTVLPKVQPL